MADIEMIRRTLQTFCEPGQVVDLRGLDVQGKRAICETFNDHEALARRAVELEAAGAKGVYFTPNPLRPDIAGWKNSRVQATDVIERHWLLLDVDTHRPVKTNATDEELQAAWVGLDRSRTTLDALGLRGAMIGCSGNGWHLCYPVRYPNDPAAHDLLQKITEELRARCADPISKEEEKLVKAGHFLSAPKVKIDSTYDAPRIWKLYGTMARKGPDVPERVDEHGEIQPARPHRLSFLLKGA